MVAWKDRKSPFFQIGNEVADVFLPIIGTDCFAVYSYLVRCQFKNPELEHSIAEVKERTGIGISTVSRSLEIMASVGLIQLIRRGGSQKSKCKLCDTEKAAEDLGAVYDKSTLSWSLPREASQQIQAKIEAIRQRQQAKGASKCSTACGNPPVCVSRGNAGISPEKRQSAARETQTGTHLLREERRIEESPTPTPTPTESSAAPEDKDSPDEDEPDGLLKWAVAQFTGPMNDLGDHLFDTSRPPAPHLANGAADWTEFGFDSLAVDEAARRGGLLVLTLGADDPAAAQLGLEKYRERWEASFRQWYGCEVEWEIQEMKRTWWTPERKCAEPEAGG